MVDEKRNFAGNFKTSGVLVTAGRQTSRPASQESEGLLRSPSSELPKAGLLFCEKEGI